MKKVGNQVMTMYHYAQDIKNKAQDLFCDAVDYLRYDQGFFATSLRVIDETIGTITSIPVVAAEKFVKFCYYEGGKKLGFSEEQLDKPINAISNFVDDKINKAMDLLADLGVNVRFVGDLAAVVLHVVQYTPMGKLTRGGIQKIKGIYNEGARRYRNRLIDQAKKLKDKNLQNINRDYGGLRHRRNIERYRENRAMAEAKRRAIKDDYNKQVEEIKKMNVLKDPKFRNKILPRLYKDAFKDLYKYLKEYLKDRLKELKKYFKNLWGNLLWLWKEEYKSFWYNFGDHLSGKMGLYGFHTCPYGCGRPIPDAFKGCTELLDVFPDYFDKNK